MAKSAMASQELLFNSDYIGEYTPLTSRKRIRGRSGPKLKVVEYESTTNVFTPELAQAFSESLLSIPQETTMRAIHHWSRPGTDTPIEIVNFMSQLDPAVSRGVTRLLGKISRPGYFDLPLTKFIAELPNNELIKNMQLRRETINFIETAFGAQLSQA